MVYLDANVFVLALLAKDELGDAAKRILARLEKIDAKTCCLTFDEVTWAVSKVAGLRAAAEMCRTLLALKYLKVVPVELGDIWDMTLEMEAFELRPRDALHLAVMKRLGERSIVSEDPHFDKAKVKRVSIRTFARSI